ncbi:MAG TPA: maleylpyruvate isomerase family mycothiol-dependent enzyme [Acidimicrobiia bacterium]|nr:maleylpyruvate isomerase family mycothiol-dependent enzyme [Acidimicrobiia bacterium]
MTNPGVLYAEGRSRVTALLSEASDDEAERRVPTCPEWRVRDVAAHLAGSCADILAGRLDGVATETWTSAQVHARAGRSLAEILDEWNEVAPQVEAIAEYFPGRTATQWMFDMTTHEHDLRLALDRPGARDAPAVAVSVDFLLTVGLDSALRTRGLGPLEVVTETRSRVVGGGEPPPDDADVVALTGEAATAALMSTDDREPPSGPLAGHLVASDFELLRALSGRRSLDQVQRLKWSGVDPAVYAAAFPFGPFRPSPVDIEE